MQLPFTHQQFLDVFATYHRLFWPVILLLWVVTLAVLVFWWRRGAGASPVVAGLLAFHWAWSGVAYHFALFRAINPTAGIFAAMFVAQALLIVWTGVIRRRLIFTPSGRGWGAVGLALVAYAMAYPGVAVLSGLSYPVMPTFGVPCPSAILTAGLLLFLAPSAARIPVWITVIWSGIGGSAAFVLDVRPDLALPLAGGLVLIHVLRPVRRAPTVPDSSTGGGPLVKAEPMHVPRVPIILSLIATGLSCVTSLAGILRPETYALETRAWTVQAVGQDYANLLVAGALVWSAVLLRRGSLRALYFWLGCLLYLVYAFAIYAFAVHFNQYFLAYVAVLGLSFYAVVGSVAALDATEATAPLRGQPHLKGAGNLLVIIGILFGGLWLSEVLPHTFANTRPSSLAETGLWTNPVHVLDLAFLLPAMVLVGVLTRRRNRWGLLFVIPLLVFAVTMGLAILALFALSALEGLPVAASGAVVVGILVVLGAVYTTLLLRQHDVARSGTGPVS